MTVYTTVIGISSLFKAGGVAAVGITVGVTLKKLRENSTLVIYIRSFSS